MLATCVGAATHSLRDEEFDLVVIDEAAQVRGKGIVFCSFLGLVRALQNEQVDTDDISIPGNAVQCVRFKS